MAVLLQTSQGDLVVDLHTGLAPLACKNFLKLCKCVRALPGACRRIS
jgi:peptidyl-prolyl cis-trans isomerase-like 4